jgi:hypothetical protein
MGGSQSQDISFSFFEMQKYFFLIIFHATDAPNAPKDLKLQLPKLVQHFLGVALA